jgi:hypothetical protein
MFKLLRHSYADGNFNALYRRYSLRLICMNNKGIGLNVYSISWNALLQIPNKYPNYPLLLLY